MLHEALHEELAVYGVPVIARGTVVTRHAAYDARGSEIGLKACISGKWKVSE